MKIKPGRLIILLILIPLVLNQIFGTRGFYTLFKLNRKCDKLEQTIVSDSLKLDSLTTVEKRLESDPKYIERVAREKLGVHKSGEVVIKFIDKQ